MTDSERLRIITNVRTLASVAREARNRALAMREARRELAAERSQSDGLPVARALQVARQLVLCGG